MGTYFAQFVKTSKVCLNVPSGFTSLAVANIQQFQLYDKNNVIASVSMNGYCWLCAEKRPQNI